MTTCSREFHHYCIVRKDIPDGLAGAMVLHAAGQTGPAPTGSVAVLLEVSSEVELRALAESCTDAHLITECDGEFAGQAMAIGFPPCMDKRKDLGHLRLWKKVQREAKAVVGESTPWPV